jgi:catechol 2,3-dioxygenase-like lactoylglutathione lyase family enzyme
MYDAFVSFAFVRDLDAADAFYRGRLGLDLVTDQGACRIYRVTAGGFLGLCDHRPPTPPDAVILTLVRDDVESFCESLAADGVQFEKEPSHNETFGITQAFLRDPDGNLVEIQRFDDPEWSVPI